MKLKSFCLFIVTLILFGCQKGELPIPAHIAGDVVSANVNMEGNYKWQIYFDLKTNTVVGQNLKTSWDLGFETTAQGYRIILNTSKPMFAENTNSTDFSAVSDTSGFDSNKSWDAPSGDLDSTAIGDWRNKSEVYIIDRGYTEMGTHMGFRKIQFLSFDADKFTIRFAELDGNGETTFDIPKDSTYNFTFFSFSSGGKIVTVEPPKKDWDLVFTQYTHIFYDPFTPYLVTGCLLNRFNTFAAREGSANFHEINFEAVSRNVFSDHINTIGYEWKSFDGSTYVTHPELNYLIGDQDGFFYKLHFIDFYSSTGIKGNPTWEYQEL